MNATFKDVMKTIVTFLFCAGFVAFGFAVMFGMPPGAQ